MDKLRQWFSSLPPLRWMRAAVLFIAAAAALWAWRRYAASSRSSLYRQQAAVTGDKARRHRKRAEDARAKAIAAKRRGERQLKALREMDYQGMAEKVEALNDV